MLGKGSNFSRWQSVFSFAQFKKDVVYSYSKSRLEFWIILSYVGLQALTVCGVIIYQVFQSIFRGNEILVFKQIIYMALSFIIFSLFFRGFVLLDFFGEREKRSVRSIFVACGGVLFLFLIGKVFGMQQ
ncbi:MAG: hypothetical protein AB7H48_05090 [Parachlamydiales bacterium]